MQMWKWGLEQGTHSHGPPDNRSGLSLPDHPSVTTHSSGPVLGDTAGLSSRTFLGAQDSPLPH